MKLRRRSMWVRMGAIFLVAVLPVYLVGYFIYKESSEQVVGEILRTRTGQMEYYINAALRDLQGLIVMQSRCASDTAINVIANRYHDLSIYEWGRQINTHMGELMTLKNMNGHVVSATSYFPGLGKKIDSVSGPSDMTASDIALNQAAEQTRERIFWHEGDPYIAASVRINRDHVIYSVITRLSRRQFLLDIQGLGESREGAAALVLTSGHTVAQTRDGFGEAALSALGDAPTGKTGAIDMDIDGASVVPYVYSQPLGMVCFTAIPRAHLYQATAGFERRLWLFFLTASLVVAVFTLLMSQGFYRPLKKLIAGFDKLEAGDLQAHIDHARRDEFGRLYDEFNRMVQNLSAHIDLAYTQRMMRQQAELIQLQSQINPHFLYNSYFLLRRMIQSGDTKSAQLFSRHMGDYFRYITRTAKQRVPLRDEQSHARTYTEIQAMRFAGRISIQFDALPGRCAEVSVPRLILQPLLENAFEHGLREKAEDGIVWLSFIMNDDDLIIAIEDNGDDMTDERIANMNARGGDEITAIVNIHSRLQSIYGQQSGLFFSRSDLGGLKAELIMKGALNDASVDCG